MIYIGCFYIKGSGTPITEIHWLFFFFFFNYYFIKLNSKILKFNPEKMNVLTIIVYVHVVYVCMSVSIKTITCTSDESDIDWIIGFVSAWIYALRHEKARVDGSLPLPLRSREGFINWVVIEWYVVELRSLRSRFEKKTKHFALIRRVVLDHQIFQQPCPSP